MQLALVAGARAACWIGLCAGLLAAIPRASHGQGIERAEPAAGAHQAQLPAIGGPNVPGRVLAVRADSREVDLQIEAAFEVGFPKVNVITVRLPEAQSVDDVRVGSWVLLRFRPEGGRFALHWLGILRDPPADRQ